LFLTLVAGHVLVIGGATVFLVDAPDTVVQAARSAAEQTTEKLVDEAAGRPDLHPARAPADIDISPVPQRASGRFDIAPVHAQRTARPGALTYRVEVERGLPYDAAGFAHAVDRTFAAPNGWAAGPDLDFTRVDGEADFRVVLASPKTVDRLCAPLDTNGLVSCRNRDDVVINAWRWWAGAETYGDDVAAYRTYVINHEAGHFLGHHHEGCPRPGDPAPVMVQQTLDLDGCVANPWPTAAELE
jgi:hypothetical protein